MPATTFKDFDCQVTREDIENGIPRDERLCPVSLALKRHYPAVRTKHSRLYLSNADETETAEVRNHQDLVDWIARFDQANTKRRKSRMKPITIQVRELEKSGGLVYANAVPTNQRDGQE